MVGLEYLSTSVLVVFLFLSKTEDFNFPSEHVVSMQFCMTLLFCMILCHSVSADLCVSITTILYVSYSVGSV